MPGRLGHTCASPGCGAVVTTRYCGRHTPAPVSKPWKGMQAAPRAGTYDARHFAWRRRVLGLYPYCPCGRRATQAHHVMSVRDGGDPYDADNGRGLCHDCHSSETAREIQARRRKAMPDSAVAFCKRQKAT